MSSVQREESVHSLIIPLQDWGLIVPSAMIAEVVPVQHLTPVPGTEPWLIGVMGWRSRPVPVVSFNGLLGAEEPASGRRSRLVVFYPFQQRQATDFFAVLSAVEPQPKLFESSSEFGEPIDMPAVEGIAVALRLGTTKVLIPDLDGLVRRLYPVFPAA